MRDVFLAEIKANPYDECVKKIFADWLDEHDEPELADVYRNWDLQHHLFCEDYLKEFVEDLTKNHYFEVHTDKPLTYEKLLELVENYVLYGNECDFCFGRDTPDRCYYERERIIERGAYVLCLHVKDLDGRLFTCSC